MTSFVRIIKGKVQGRTFVAKAIRPFEADSMNLAGDRAIAKIKIKTQMVTKLLIFFKSTSKDLTTTNKIFYTLYVYLKS